MRYDCLKEFKDEEFRRLTGVKRTTFEKKQNPLKNRLEEDPVNYP